MYHIFASFGLNHISYIGIDINATKQIPSRKYDVIMDTENTFDVNLSSKGPDRFIMIPVKAVP
jgi:hypothetical protein